MLITILIIAVLILSAAFHEYAHAWMGTRLGDDTAERAGRLTLNPIAHIDWFGSIILPLILVISNMGVFIAWAKPVPYNPYNLRDKKFGDLKVALAGPATNFILAIIFGLVARFFPVVSGTKTRIAVNFLVNNNDGFVSLISGSILNSLAALAMIVCLINLMLGIFNLIPFPPLDGSKIVVTLLPERARLGWYRAEQYGMILLLILMLLGAFGFIVNWMIYLFSWIVGV